MTPAQKGKLIIAGLRKAVCKYCGKPGQTRLCRCKPHMRLLNRNNRIDYNLSQLAGPMGKLP